MEEKRGRGFLQHPNCSLIASFHDRSGSDCNFMGVTNLKIYKGLDCE